MVFVGSSRLPGGVPAGSVQDRVTRTGVLPSVVSGTVNDPPPLSVCSLIVSACDTSAVMVLAAVSVFIRPQPN